MYYVEPRRSLYRSVLTSCSKNVKLEDLRVCNILSSVISVLDICPWLDLSVFA